MRIAILWPALSGYLNACLHALAQLPDTEIFVSYCRPSSDTPFDEEQFGWLHSSYFYQGEPDGAVLSQRLEAFRPDLMLVNSWHIAGYRHVLRHTAPHVPRVLAMDNNWLGTLKQWLGVVVAPVYIHRLYDFVLLPGERQAVFARRLGVRDSQIWDGLYVCDHAMFSV